MPFQTTPSLSQFIFKLIKPYKNLLFAMGLVGVIWAFINTFSPYVLKLIIDHVVNLSGNKSTLLESTKFYVMIYILLWLCMCINMRVLDWVKLKLFPQLREDVMTQMFSYLNLGICKQADFYRIKTTQ